MATPLKPWDPGLEEILWVWDVCVFVGPGLEDTLSGMFVRFFVGLLLKRQVAVTFSAESANEGPAKIAEEASRAHVPLNQKSTFETKRPKIIKWPWVKTPHQ